MKKSKPANHNDISDLKDFLNKFFEVIGRHHYDEYEMKNLIAIYCRMCGFWVPYE